MNNGWIKTYRQLVDWEWYRNSNMVHLFIHLILKANHKPKKYMGKVIERGQLITGRKLLSAETGISEQSVRTCLQRLAKSKELTIKTTNKNSLITIIKYDYYQSDDKINQPTNQQSTNNQPTINQQSTTNKNDKKEKNVKNDKNKEKKEVIFIFDSIEFKKNWLMWKDYKKTDHKFTYKSELSEQAALNKLNTLSGGFEATAIKIIHQSIENGWKGFFQLKNESNGKEQSSLTEEQKWSLVHDRDY
jgi:hypothetical protein